MRRRRIVKLENLLEGRGPGFPRLLSSIFSLVGCLWTLGSILIFLLCAGTIAFFIFNVFRSSEPYQMAMAELETNDRAIEVLGQPIKAGYLMSGSLNDSGQSGSADLSIPVSGPRGKGRLQLFALKEEGVWRLRRLVLTSEDLQQPIDLLEDR